MVCKVGRYRNHRVYTLRCKDEHLTPPSLRLKRPINTKRGHDVIKRAEKHLVQARIHEITNKLSNITREKQKQKEEIFRQVNDDTRDTLDQMFERAHDREYMQSKARQKQKLQRLLQKKPDRETHMDLSGTQLKKWVINLSKRELSKAETTVLARGLNFAVTPDRLPVNDVIVQTEKACGLIPEEREINSGLKFVVHSNLRVCLHQTYPRRKEQLSET